jgi:transcriptional regulator with XRE-family HTH domain
MSEVITMSEKEALHAKTTLEYLVLVNEKSYSQIGRELSITPQQFSDWIKKRRPIPKERLRALSEYFQVQEICLVDEKNFARNLTEVTKIDIQMLLVKKIIEKGEEEIGPYEEKLRKLEGEKAKQMRIGRLAAILHQENEEIDMIIDAVLEQIESGNITKLNSIING